MHFTQVYLNEIKILLYGFRILFSHIRKNFRCVTSDDLTFRSSANKSEDEPKPKAKKKVRIKTVAMRRRIRHKPVELERAVSLDTLAKDQR